MSICIMLFCLRAYTNITCMFLLALMEEDKNESMIKYVFYRLTGKGIGGGFIQLFNFKFKNFRSKFVKKENIDQKGLLLLIAIHFEFQR